MTTAPPKFTETVVPSEVPLMLMVSPTLPWLGVTEVMGMSFLLFDRLALGGCAEGRRDGPVAAVARTGFRCAEGWKGRRTLGGLGRHGLQRGPHDR
ncbi:hypothetical protein GCM10010376_26420 [Streptomyces violaceusniger]